MLRNVRCVNKACERSGIVVSVPDRLIARGIVARPPLYCAVCGQEVWDDGRDVTREVPVEAAVKSPPERTVKRPPVRRTS